MQPDLRYKAEHSVTRMNYKGNEGAISLGPSRETLHSIL